MPDFQHKELSGSLFKNEFKEKESQPDYKGNCVIEGVDYSVAAWVNESRNTGKKYFSLKFNPKGEDTGSKRPTATEIPDDDIPF